MPRYDYRCPAGHITESIYPMGEAPTVIDCPRCPPPDPTSMESLEGPEIAYRVYTPPVAIHFHGPGFYATDVKGTLHRRRRANPGDDLHKEFQTDTAKIAEAI